MEGAVLRFRPADRTQAAQIDSPVSRGEAVVIAFRRHTLLPLDDCLYALQPTIPHLTRSSLHRCLQRRGISRLPQVEGEASPKRKFKASSAISSPPHAPRLPRGSVSNVALCLPQPEPELGLPIFVRPNSVRVTAPTQSFA
jgi:hypothetical protein